MADWPHSTELHARIVRHPSDLIWLSNGLTRRRYCRQCRCPARRCVSLARRRAIRGFPPAHAARTTTPAPTHTKPSHTQAQVQDEDGQLVEEKRCFNPSRCACGVCCQNANRPQWIHVQRFSQRLAYLVPERVVEARHHSALQLPGPLTHLRPLPLLILKRSLRMEAGMR